MGRCVVRQPDGKLAEWTTIVDGFTMVGATKDILIENQLAEIVEKERERLEREADIALHRGVSSGSTRDWNECLLDMWRVHGRDEVVHLLGLASIVPGCKLCFDTGTVVEFTDDEEDPWTEEECPCNALKTREEA